MGIIEEQATQVTEETELADSLTHMDSIPLSTDSMVTVRLSDPQPSALLVEPAEVVVPHHEAVAGRTELGADGIEDAHDLKSATKLMEVQAIDHQEGDVLYRTSAVSGHSKDDSEEVLSAITTSSNRSRRSSSSTTSTESSTRVDWEELEKTEEQEPRDEGSDEVGYIRVARAAESTVALIFVVHGFPSRSA